MISTDALLVMMMARSLESKKETTWELRWEFQLDCLMANDSVKMMAISICALGQKMENL